MNKSTTDMPGGDRQKVVMLMCVLQEINDGENHEVRLGLQGTGPPGDWAYLAQHHRYMRVICGD